MSTRLRKRVLVTYSKQRPDINVKAQVSKGRCDDLATAVVAVLTDLGHQNTRAPALFVLKFL